MSNFIQTHKRTLVVFVFLALATALSGIAVFFSTPAPVSTPAAQPVTQTSTAVFTPAPATTTSPSAQIKRGVVADATIIIDGTQYPVSASTSVYDALKKLSDARKISIVFKEYPGMGYFIDSINGVADNNQTGEYWIYYINGQSAQVGISSYIIKSGDTITWKYETAKF